MGETESSAVQPPVPRQVRCKLADLVDAFEGSPNVDVYLDLDTGAVIHVTEDIRVELELVSETLPADQTDEEHTEALLAAIAQHSPPNWMHDLLIEADAVERDFGRRYLPLPHRDSSGAYMDMEAFIATVRRPQLANALWDAIPGRGAFRRFNALLDRDPSERERWFAFKEARVRERVREWLADEGIEPVEPDTT